MIAHAGLVLDHAPDLADPVLCGLDRMRAEYFGRTPAEAQEILARCSLFRTQHILRMVEAGDWYRGSVVDMSRLRLDAVRRYGEILRALDELLGGQGHTEALLRPGRRNDLLDALARVELDGMTGGP